MATDARAVGGIQLPRRSAVGAGRLPTRGRIAERPAGSRGLAPPGWRRWLVAGLLSLALGTVSPAWSAEPSESPPGAIELPGVTVEGSGEQIYNPSRAAVGTKIDLPLMDVPMSIEVIPRQIIDDQRALSLADVLRNVSGFSPSITSQSQRFGDRNFILRGFTVNDFLTNGYKDAFNGPSFSFAMANIERVEVLKGPASVLYGLGSPGGTINVVTRQPLADWYGAAWVTAGSFNFVNPSLDVSGPLTPGKALRFRLTASYQHEDSFVDFVESERYLVAPVVSLAFGPRTLLTLEGEFQGITDLYYTGLPNQGTVDPNINGRIPISRYLGDKKLEGTNFPERSLLKYGYRFEHQFNELVGLRNGFRVSFFGRNDRDVILFGLEEDQRTMLRSFFTAQGSAEDYYSLTELTFDFKTGPIGHRLLVGSDQRFPFNWDTSADVEIEPIDVFAPVYGNIPNPIGPDTPRRKLNQSGTFIGLYIEDYVTLLHSLKLLAGFRYDWASQDTRSRNTGTGILTKTTFDDGVFTPRVGLVYQPVQPVALYFNYSTSFQPLLGTTFNGNAFVPERGVQYEGGVKLDLLNGRLSATLAGYQITKQNVLTPDPNNPGFLVQNGEQRSRGFEMDVAGEPFPGFRVIAAYAYTDARITQSDFGTQGNIPANVPTNTGSIWGTYEFQKTFLKGLGFGLGIIGVGSRPADNENTVTLPSFVRTDAAIYHRRWRPFEIAVNFRNLFDIRYWEASTFSDPFTGISPGAPFSVYGTITARY